LGGYQPTEIRAPSTLWGIDAHFSSLLFSSLLFSSLVLSGAAGCLPPGEDSLSAGSTALAQPLVEQAPDLEENDSDAECVTGDPPRVLEVAAWSLEPGTRQVALEVQQLEPLQGFFEVAVDVAGPQVRHQTRVRVEPSAGGALTLDLGPFLPARGPAQITLTARLMVEEFMSYEAEPVVLAYSPGAAPGIGEFIAADAFRAASQRPEDRIDVTVTLGALPVDDDGDGDHDHSGYIGWGGAQ
jgi:hypothetical protein